jgi:hypothetical protein
MQDAGGELRRISLPRTPVNKGYLTRLRLPRVPRFGYDAKLLHHAQLVAHPPVFYGFAIPKAYEVHVVLSHRASGRGHAHQGPLVGATHAQTARDGVSLGDQVLDREVQVREGRAQHGDQGSYRLGAAIPSWMRLVI